jgi:hypothetical protein
MSENKIMSKESPQESASQNVNETQQVNLVNIPITSENISLNVMVGFLNVAQKRGVFNVQESAKIWECIQVFQKQTGPSGPESGN